HGGRRRAAARDWLIVERALVRSHRHLAAALHPALHRAALRPQLVARGRTRHLLIAASGWVVVAAIAIGRDRLVVVAGAIGRDRFVVTLRLVAGHRLIIAALHIARRADRLRRRTRVAARVRRVVANGRALA